MLVVQIAIGVALGLLLFAFLPALLEAVGRFVAGLAGLAVVLAVVGLPWIFAEYTGAQGWLYVYPTVGALVATVCLASALWAWVKWLRRNPRMHAILSLAALVGLAVAIGGPMLAVNLGLDQWGTVGTIVLGVSLIVAARIAAGRFDPGGPARH